MPDAHRQTAAPPTRAEEEVVSRTGWELRRPLYPPLDLVFPCPAAGTAYPRAGLPRGWVPAARVTPSPGGGATAASTGPCGGALWECGGDGGWLPRCCAFFFFSPPRTNRGTVGPPARHGAPRHGAAAVAAAGAPVRAWEAPPPPPRRAAGHTGGRRQPPSAQHAHNHPPVACPAAPRRPATVVDGVVEGAGTRRGGIPRSCGRGRPRAEPPPPPPLADAAALPGVWPLSGRSGGRPHP